MAPTTRRQTRVQRSVFLPSETIASILSHLHPIRDRTALRTAALLSRSWYNQVFPLLHRELILTRWSPKSVEQLERDLKAHKNIARAITRLQLPSTMITEQGRIRNWVDENLKIFVDVVRAEVQMFLWVCSRCNRAECGGSLRSLTDMATTEARDEAERALEKEKDVDFIKDGRRKGEQAFFELLRYLPALREINLSEFRNRVGLLGVEDVGQSSRQQPEVGSMVIGLELEEEEEEEEHTSDDERRQRPAQYTRINTVFVSRCSAVFKESFTKYWRFN